MWRKLDSRTTTRRSRLPCQSLPAAMEGFVVAAASSGGDASLGASLALQRRRRRIGGGAWSPLARIIGIKRPICRPMIASPSTTWFDSARRDCSAALRSRHAQLPLGKLRYGQQKADEARSRAGRRWPWVPNEHDGSRTSRDAARTLTRSLVMQRSATCEPRENLHWNRALSSLSSSSSRWVGDLERALPCVESAPLQVRKPT